MKLNGKYRRSIERVEDGIEILDQRVLPREIKLVRLSAVEQVAIAIKEMWVRGAPLIGATAAYGLCFALEKNVDLQAAYKTLLATRPTAINLKWSLDQMMQVLVPLKPDQRIEAAYKKAQELCDEDAAIHEAIGTHGLKLFEKIYAEKKRLNILTHCNAGWLACVDWGTALAPIYKAHEKAIPVHVWVDETRPRNQGALTAFELSQAGVPNTVIVDNAGGLLMQQGLIDLCIVGTDRTLKNGDVCNKIGTYLKALAAKDNNVPFYVALPYTTIDWDLADASHIEIEERAEAEVLGEVYAIGAKAANPAFDITPARLVTSFITERGVCDSGGLGQLFGR